MITASGNARLTWAIGELHRSFPRNLTWAALQNAVDLFGRSATEHEAILSAIAARDGDLAQARMIEHVLNAGELLAAWFQPQNPAG